MNGQPSQKKIKYTTVEAIALRLVGRLELPELNDPQNLFSNSLGSQRVDPRLIEQLASQKEAYIDTILSVIYEMPLRLTSNTTKGVLADIIESFVVSDLMKIHYLGSQTVGLSQDVAGAAINDRQHAEFLLQVYATGHGIQFPGMNSIGASPGMTPPQPVLLPEERLRSSPQDSITRSYSRVGKRKSKTGTELDNIDWGLGSGNQY